MIAPSATPVDEEAWRTIGLAVEGIKLHISSRNTPVVIDDVPAPLRVVGFGTDAVAVQHPARPDVVFKVYAAEKLRCLDDELESYRRLAGSRFFPACFGRGPSHLILSYERGPTLLECLVQGIPIGPDVIDEVEEARRQARQVGLFPKDIHLKNVLVQPSGVKVLDLSRYVVPGDDAIWDHLVIGYRRLYPLIRGRPVPMPVVDLVKQLYRARRPDDASIESFVAQVARYRRIRFLAAGVRRGGQVTVPVSGPVQ